MRLAFHRMFYEDLRLVRCMLTITLAVSLAATVSAQLNPRGRYEKEMKNSDNGFTIIPMLNKDIALIRERNRFNEGKRLWELILLDSTLTENWTTHLELESDFDLVGYEVTPAFVYFLFRKGDRESNKFILSQINLLDHAINKFEVNHEFSFRLTHFTVVGENAVFGGYVSREPAVLLYETQNKHLKVIPGFFLKDTELLDVRVNHNKTFNTLLIERNALDKRHLVMKTFDESGALLLEDYIEFEKDKNIVTGICSSLKREELLIVGTYTESVATEALGYYSVLVDPFTDQPIQYHPFTTLTHILDYMPPKRAARVKSKSEDRIAAGRNPDYKAYIHPVRIEETDEGFYFLSEMYDPASTINNNRAYWNNNYYNPYYGYGYSPYSFNPYSSRYSNSPYPYSASNQNNSVKMTEAILTLFDAKGKLVWDTSLKFDDIKYYSLRQTSDFLVKQKIVFLAYKKESELFTNTTPLYEDAELDTVKIPLKNSGDYVRYESEDDSGIRFWYQNHLYAWGYQSIRDKAKTDEEPVRYVFYINKFEAE